jgi:hypothetical protein
MDQPQFTDATVIPFPAPTSAARLRRTAPSAPSGVELPPACCPRHAHHGPTACADCMRARQLRLAAHDAASVAAARAWQARHAALAS